MTDSQGSDFVDDIVQDRLPAHTEPPRDQFQPWHRVRKEYIRRFQWNELTARAVKRYWRRQLHHEESDWTLDDTLGADQPLSLPRGVFLGRALTCLVIPGDDLLDVRALWRDTQMLNCHIRYLGFNESQGSDQQGTHIHVSNNAVTSLPHVVRDSRVVQDRFETIARTESQAYRYLKEYGPYHVVNLDLCGSMFPNTAKPTREYYDALLRLLTYQFEHQKTEWLLFITTMMEPAMVEADGLQALCAPTRENFNRHKDFAEHITKVLPKEAFEGADAAVDLSRLGEEEMVPLFGVALGKWLLSLCQRASPQWTVAMRRSFRYFTNEDKGVVLLSLAFELKPNFAPPVDTTGMATLEVSARSYPDERACAVKLAESVANIRDVDSILHENAELKTELRDAQALLLEAAGYDRDAYVRWVDNGELQTGRK